MKRKEIIQTLIFVLPYIFIEFSNTILVTIDKSISNSIGKTAIIVFTSFVTLNWAINTVQTCISQAHSIILVRDKKNYKDINTSAMAMIMFFAIITSILIYCFAYKITYIYELEQDTREILTVILKLKAIQLPLVALGYVPRNNLKVNEKTKTIFVIVIASSIVNIVGDLISVKYGFNEKGIYIATILSTCVSSALFLILSKFEIGKISIKYIKELVKYGKDLVFNKIVQRIVNLFYMHVASSFGTEPYAIHCVCVGVSDLLSESIEGYYSGLLIAYSKDIENENKYLIKKVDKIEVIGTAFSVILAFLLVYPTWWMMGRAISWETCKPFIGLYLTEFVMTVASCNYRAYLSANKDTKAIRMMAFIGGLCVRVPYAYFVKCFNLGLYGLSLACGIDRAVRTLYLRLYIRKNYSRGEK